MPSQSEEHSTPWWLWPNLLSLDAPTVAVLWQSFLAHHYSLPLSPAARAALGLTVWATYLLDRLLDARQPASAAEPARHRFYRRHARLMWTILAIASTADALIAALWLRPIVVRDGLITLAGVAAYLALVHLGGITLRIPKEIAAAVLFTGGTFLTAWATLPCPSLAFAAAAFFVLCLANIIAIETWESSDSPLQPLTRWLARTYLFWVPAAVIVCALLGRNPWYASIALSAAACAGLFLLGRRVSLDARRVLVDGVLLSPIFFLILR
jgi:hypothetical protein